MKKMSYLAAQQPYGITQETAATQLQKSRKRVVIAY
jgi:hypothetical protein